MASMQKIVGPNAVNYYGLLQKYLQLHSLNM